MPPAGVRTLENPWPTPGNPARAVTMLVSRDTGRLLTAFRPTKYTLFWDLRAVAPPYKGRVTIEGTWASTGPLALHASRQCLDVFHVNLRAHGTDHKAVWQWSPEDAGQVVAAPALQEGLQPGDVVAVTITFAVRPPRDPRGLYVAKTDGVTGTPQVIVTQFEPTAARCAFPCVDEPAAKAVFTVAVAAPEDWLVLGNAATRGQWARAGGGVTTGFHPTPRMSPYVVAVVAAAPGQLTLGATRTVGHTLVRVWCPGPAAACKTVVAADTAVTALAGMAALTGVPYGLPKLDLVPVSAFDSGAMENWGLLVFRPSALLVGRDAAPGALHAVADTVAHEVAHQWFGNAVTCPWWDSLWLNEGFATLCATWVRAGSLDPDHPLWLRWLAGEVPGVLPSRAVVDDRPVVTDTDIAAQFDGATYVRAAAVLRLVCLTIGEAQALAGLQAYLQLATTLGEGCGSEALLWQALGPVARTVGAPWLRVPGVVVVPAGGGGAAPAGLPLVGLAPSGRGLAVTSAVYENTGFVMPAVVLGPVGPAAPECVGLSLAHSPATALATAVASRYVVESPGAPQAAVAAACAVLKAAAAPAQEGEAFTPARAEVAAYARGVILDWAAVCGGEAAPPALGAPVATSEAEAILEDVPAALRPSSGWSRAQVLGALRAATPAQLAAAYTAVVATDHEWAPAVIALLLGRAAAAEAMPLDEAVGVVQAHHLPDLFAGAADNAAALWRWLDAAGGWARLHTEGALGKFGLRSVMEAAGGDTVTPADPAVLRRQCEAVFRGTPAVLTAWEIEALLDGAAARAAAHGAVRAHVCGRAGETCRPASP
jgi:hypothetical protein